MGLLAPEEPGIEFDEVVDEDDVIWPAYTDEDDELVIDVDYEVEVWVTGVVIGKWIYPAWVDGAGRLHIDLDVD